jgi:hypothetical protein
VVRLQEAERQARKAGIELVSVQLQGEARTVKLLRLGGVMAWWLSLDGAAAGAASIEAGDVQLHVAETPQQAEAIGGAFAIAEGRSAPRWVLLPTEGLQVR